MEELAGKAMALAEQFGGEDVSADDFDEADGDDAAGITDDEELVDVE